MNKTIQSRIQHPVHTAATLTAKNPVLLKGEVVYESDTRKHKIGDGATAWNALSYVGGGNFEGPVSASNITQDANHRFVSDAEKTPWNGKASTAVATRSANGLMSAADKKKLDVIPTQGLISSSTMTLGSTLKLSSNVSYLEGRGYVSYIREIGRTQTSFAIDSTIPAGSAPLQIIELVLRCIAGLENNLTISLLLAGDAANSSIAIPKGSKLITLSFMMLNGHIDKYSCYRVSVI